MNSAVSVRCTDWLTLGWQKDWKSVMNPMGDVSWKSAVAGTYIGSDIQWGLNLSGDSPTIMDTKVTDATLYFHHRSNKCC